MKLKKLNKLIYFLLLLSACNTHLDHIDTLQILHSKAIYESNIVDYEIIYDDNMKPQVINGENSTYYIPYEAELYYLLQQYFLDMLDTGSYYFYFPIGHSFRGGNPAYVDRIALRNMYLYLNERFNLAVLQNQQFTYVGYFTGDDKFVNNPPFYIPNFNARNVQVTDMHGNPDIITNLRGIQISRRLYSLLDNRVVIGRNFDSSDFYIHSYNDPISILLGYNYIGVHELGDILTLSLYTQKSLDFKVIGFLNQDTYLRSLDGIFDYIYFDSSIVMPFFSFTFEPTSPESKLFRNIYYSRRTAGIIKISANVHELTSSVTEFMNIARKYERIIQEIGQQHGLYYFMALLPVDIPMLNVPIYVE